MSAPSRNHFDRSKPYYPYVIHYVVGLWAMKELAAHGAGIVARAEGQEHLMAGLADDPDDSDRINDAARRILDNPLVELLPPLELQTKSDSDGFAVDIAEIAEDINRNAIYLFGSTMRAAGGLLISAYEISKQHNDHGETWEFFRHVRNAAAHGGAFNLRGREPTRPAKWRGIEITPALQDSALFDGPSLEERGLLRPGDPLSLLWDVEQTLPSSET